MEQKERESDNIELKLLDIQSKSNLERVCFVNIKL